MLEQGNTRAVERNGMGGRCPSVRGCGQEGKVEIGRAKGMKGFGKVITLN